MKLKKAGYFTKRQQYNILPNQEGRKEERVSRVLQERRARAVRHFSDYR